MTRKEVSKISPEAEKYCTELFDKAVNMGPYTPYGMVPSLVFPGSEGGGGWGGVATNSTLGLIFINTRHLGVIAQLQPSMSSGVLPSFSKSKMPTTFYTDPQGYPCNAPPWSEIVAVSTTTGDIVWRTPLGEYPELEGEGHTDTGTALNDGGPIATASGLVFIGATGDFGFRAFDAKTGKELWKATLDNDVLMTPMTYHGRERQAVRRGGGWQRRRGVSHSRAHRAAEQREARGVRASVTEAHREDTMDRREFFHDELDAGPLRRGAFSQQHHRVARRQRPRRHDARACAAGAGAPAAPARPLHRRPRRAPLVLDAYSRCLHWLRDAR